ncbi:MAG: CHAT domain-containing tetratricopeptide repeat protein [Planctomycetota bacterium]|jgi:tetratricopeptide (TPR) repeat protein
MKFLPHSLLILLVCAPLFAQKDPGPAEESVVIVVFVEVGSPAHKAGVKPGDILLSFGGKAIRTLADIPAVKKAAKAAQAPDSAGVTHPLILEREEKGVSSEVKRAITAGRWGVRIEAHPRSKVAEVRLRLAKAARAIQKFQEGIALGRAGKTAEAIRTLEAGFALAKEAGDLELMADLIGTIGDIHKGAGRLPLALKCFQQALDLSRKAGNRLKEAQLLRDLGNVFRALGRAAQSIENLEASIRIFREEGHRAEEAAAVFTLGNVYGQSGRYTESLEAFKRALLLYDELKDTGGKSRVLLNMGVSHKLMERRSEAAEFLQRALEIAREIGDRYVEIVSLLNLGINHSDLAEYADAVRILEEAERLCRSGDFRFQEAEALCHLGDAYRGSKKFAEAKAALEKALTLSRANGFRSTECKVVGFLSQLNKDQGRLETALTLRRQNLEIARELGDDDWERTGLEAFSDIQKALFRFDDAVKSAVASLALARKLGLGSEQARILHKIGDIYVDQGDLTRAMEQWERSLEVSRAIGDLQQEGKMLCNMGFLHIRLGRYAKALEVLQPALALAEKHSLPEVEALALSNLGAVYHGRGNNRKAMPFLERSREQVPFIKNPQVERDVLAGLGDSYMSVGRYAESLQILDKVLALARQTRDKAAQSRIHDSLAQVFVKMYQYGKAREHCQKGLALSREARNRWCEAIHLKQLALLHLKNYEYGKAQELAETSLEIFTACRDLANRANGLNALGRVHLGARRYGQAAAYFQKSLDAQREIGDRSGAAVALNNLGTIYTELGEFGKALHCYREALKTYRENGVLDSEETALRNIGYVFSFLGQNAEAMKHLEAALVIARKLEKKSAEATCLTNMGVIFAALGEKERQLECMEKAYRLMREIGNRASEALYLSNLGGVYSGEGQYRKGLDCCEESLALFRRLGSIQGLYPLHARANIFKTQGEKPPAFHHRGRFIALVGHFMEEFAEEIRIAGADVTLQEWLPWAEMQLDAAWEWRNPEAERVSVDGPWEDVPDATRKALETSPYLKMTYLEVGWRIAESFRAREFLRQMQIRNIPLEKEIPPSLLRSRDDLDARLNGVRSRLLALGSGKAGFDGKGNALDEETGAREIQRLGKKRDALLEEWRWVERSIAEANPALGALRAIRPVGLKDLQDALATDELLLEYVLTAQEAKKHRVRIGEGKDARSLLLSSEEGTPSGRAYLLAVTRDRANVFTVGATKDLADRIELFRMTLDAQHWCSSTADFIEQAHALYQELVQPALRNLGEDAKKIQHLILSPDGPLARLAFDALVTSSSTKGKKETRFASLPYLMRRFTTEYTPSATAWWHMRNGKFQRGKPGNAFVALADPDYGKGVQPDALRSAAGLRSLLSGEEAADKAEREERRNRLLAKLSPEVREAARKGRTLRGGEVLGPLPGSRKEIAAIAPLFQSGWTEANALRTPEGIPKEGAIVFFGRGAREFVARKQDLLDRAEILHFACHGIADDLTPADASVILSTEGLSETEDGFLTAAEVMGLRTNARVVVLSACETGLGRILRGEGVQGLTRAWQFAGARTVVVSLWKVDDKATADFMKRFYTALKSKTSSQVTEALAAARREMAEYDKTAPPVFWAAFTAHGER